MTYSSGGLIQATDYNTFVSNVNTTWNTFYGQSALSQAASASQTVPATQWTTLFNTITNMAAHSNTTLNPSLPSQSTGSTITALANVTTAISNCATNQLNASAQGSQFTGWSGTSSYTTAYSSVANWTTTFTQTVTFGSTSQASYFFNCGGTIAIQFNKSSTGDSGDSNWNTFVGQGAGSPGTCGVIYLSGSATSKTIAGNTYTGTTKRGGSGSTSTLATGTGYNNLSGTPTTIFQQYLTASGFTGCYVQVNASVSGAVLTLTTTWYDNSGTGITGGSATSGVSYGSAATTVVTYYPPETTYLSSSWGTPSVAASVSGSYTPGVASASYLVVGGGGSGGISRCTSVTRSLWWSAQGGGGGGGQVLSGSVCLSYSQTYNVTVGIGGYGQYYSGTNMGCTFFCSSSKGTGAGNSSSFSGPSISTVTAAGGGAGAFRGVGGFGPACSKYYCYQIGATSGSGYAGGNPWCCANASYTYTNPGAGGGAGGSATWASPGPFTGNPGWMSGVGVASSITGTNWYYGCGGMARGGFMANYPCQGSDNRYSNNTYSYGCPGGYGSGQQMQIGAPGFGTGGSGSNRQGPYCGNGPGLAGSGTVIFSYSNNLPKFQGGRLIQNGSNIVHIFCASGKLQPIGSGVIAAFLVVAGGGGGSGTLCGMGGGAGGGGGARTGYIVLCPSVNYTIVVGAGAAQQNCAFRGGLVGCTSYITGGCMGQITAIGGGGGSPRTSNDFGGYGYTLAQPGATGGGGLGGMNSTYTFYTGAPGRSLRGQGYRGAKGRTHFRFNNVFTPAPPNGGGGGGGGAGAIACPNGTSQCYGYNDNSATGNGGGGLSTQWGTFGGGGGGGGSALSWPCGGFYGYQPAGSGANGGGSGGGARACGGAGSANTGGGGGGGGAGWYNGCSCNGVNYKGGAGGSGVVIISYAGSAKFSGGCISSSGGNTIHRFNSGGTLSHL